MNEFIFYKLRLPNKNHTLNSKTNSIEDGEDIFSDPDVYVSKINKSPSNPATSE